MSKTIPLTRGKFAVVDEEDYEWTRRYKWQCSNQGYAVRAINLGNGNVITVYMHRLIMRAGLKDHVDHIDQDKLNNRRSNLRLATRSGNGSNRKKFSSRKRGEMSSRYKGVSWCKRSGRWMAYITVNKKRTTLGYFEDESEAARAYDEAALEAHGDFAYLNFARQESS